MMVYEAQASYTTAVRAKELAILHTAELNVLLKGFHSNPRNVRGANSLVCRLYNK